MIAPRWKYNDKHVEADDTKTRQKGSGMGFSLIAFRKNRWRKRLAGMILFWGGLGLLILDVTTPFPTPMKGQYAVWWLLVVALGAGLWISSKRLPLEETIEVAKYCHGQLMATDLTSELHVTLDTAERILATLARKGYAKREQRDESYIYIFPDIKK